MSNTKEIVYQAIGHGSMCWTPIPSGVFDSTEALKAGQPIVDAMDEQQATIERLTEELESERRMRIEEESLHARTEVLQAEAISRLTEERARWALRWLEMMLELLENPDNEWMTEELRHC